MVGQEDKLFFTKSTMYIGHVSLAVKPKWEKNSLGGPDGLTPAFARACHAARCLRPVPRPLLSRRPCLPRCRGLAAVLPGRASGAG